MCGGSTLNIRLDKDVNIYHAIACQSISKDPFNVNVSTKIRDKVYEILRAAGDGISTSEVTFNYEIQGDKIQKHITNNFPINIR